MSGAPPKTAPAPPKYVDGGVKTAAGGILSAFAAYDADGDGVITAEELLSLDKDGDGVVTQAEIDEILKCSSKCFPANRSTRSRHGFSPKEARYPRRCSF